MSRKNLPEGDAPTMIIPRGTEIEVDAHGQLSVRAPGNLVIQNSGSYGTIESRAGSIRIDHGVEVEAVSVRCTGDCYVLGSLTAWKVTARSLQLEETSRANIVLQETERLDVGRGARLVGNFDSEKELFLLFSRFAREFRSLPFFFERAARPAAELPEQTLHWPTQHPEVEEPAGGNGAPQESAAGAAGRRRETTLSDLPEPLFFALVLLDRDADRGEYGHTSQRVLREVIKLLQEGDVETLGLTYRTLLGRIVEPREDVRRAAELIDGYFRGDAPRPPR